MSEQIILKLGGRPMNEAALAAGVEFAKGARIPVLAYFMEDEALFQASRFSFSNEVRVCGNKRGLELHELRRETKIAMRMVNREVLRRCEDAQIKAEFVKLNGDGTERLRAQLEQPNIMVLGEHQTARQLTKDFKTFRDHGELQGILMAGPRAKRHAKGPLVVVVHSLKAWDEGFDLLKGYLGGVSDVILYCLDDVMPHTPQIVSSLEDEFDGEIEVERLKRCDQSRILWALERVNPGLFFVLPGAPYISTEKEVEALLRLLLCPIFICL